MIHPFFMVFLVWADSHSSSCINILHIEVGMDKLFPGRIHVSQFHRSIVDYIRDDILLIFLVTRLIGRLLVKLVELPAGHLLLVGLTWEYMLSTILLKTPSCKMPECRDDLKDLKVRWKERWQRYFIQSRG